MVGHLGWVHQQEARAVGRPRERMMPLREALTPRRDRAGWHEKHEAPRGGVKYGTLDGTRGYPPETRVYFKALALRTRTPGARAL